MSNYFIIRLGGDSENEIKAIDAFREFSAQPFPVDVKCRQVPKDLARGDTALIWLGTNNNKGGKTPWIQGIRAVGRIERVTGEAGYGGTKAISVSIGVVLPRSVTKMNIVSEPTTVYKSIAAMPVLGVNNYSSQVVQRIDPAEPGQDLQALFHTLDKIVPGFQRAISERYPDLRGMFQGPATRRDSAEKEENDGKEDDDGLERERFLGNDIEIPFDPTKIDITSKPMTISHLEDRLANAELDLTPDFQRQANLWDDKRKARLIESILLKIPLPSFYFSEDREGGYAVVDGLQRLCAVFHFKNAALLNRATGANLPPMRLKGLQYLWDLEGKSFDELDRKFQRRISEQEITANIIRANTPSAVKFNVFARLNQGGIPLNGQEIRNAIFPGEWRNQLRTLAESEQFISATQGRVRTNRQQDVELVLRYVALWQLDRPHLRPISQQLDEFLNSSVEDVLSRWNADEWVRARKAFYGAVGACCAVMGDRAFRKITQGPHRKPINRSLFEAEMIVFGDLEPDALSLAVARKSLIEQLLEQALRTDANFSSALAYSTGSGEASNARIETLTRIVEEAIGA